MFVLVSVMIVIVSVLLILIVLVQNSKGGGLASNFASSNQVMGVRKTADFLEKATWTLAIALLALTLIAGISVPRGGEEQRSRVEEQIDNTLDPTKVPTFPTSVPENTGNDQPGGGQ